MSKILPGCNNTHAPDSIQMSAPTVTDVVRANYDFETSTLGPPHESSIAARILINPTTSVSLRSIFTRPTGLSTRRALYETIVSRRCHHPRVNQRYHGAVFPMFDSFSIVEAVIVWRDDHHFLSRSVRRCSTVVCCLRKGPGLVDEAPD